MITPKEARKELARRELAKRGINPSSPKVPFGQKAYNFAQETLPYLAGGGGALVASPLGPEATVAGGALGYAGTKSGLRAIGTGLGYEKPRTLGNEVVQTVLGDIPQGAAMEMAPQVVGNVLKNPMVKRAGQGIADIFSTLPGVESKSVQRLFKNPMRILPKFLGGPTALKESGEQIGRMEAKYGLSGIEAREGEEVLKVKPPRGMKEGTVRIEDPNRAYDIDKLEKMKVGMKGKRLQDVNKAISELKALKGAGSPENDRQVAARVFNEMKQGKMPDMENTQRAIRGIDNRLEGMGENATTAEYQNKLLLTRTRQKLVNHLSEMAPDLQKARSEYAAGKTREAFTRPGFGLMAQSGDGTAISRIGANRLVGPFALTRMATNPAFGLLLGASQSPLALGLGTAGLGALTKGLESRITPYLIKSFLEGRKRREQLRSTPTQQPQ